MRAFVLYTLKTFVKKWKTLKKNGKHYFQGWDAECSEIIKRYTQFIKYIYVYTFYIQYKCFFKLLNRKHYYGSGDTDSLKL